ncbi:MAG TPA: FecR domain-containing protein [Rhodothermales bacterium]|nr:FecR domain-containing protein [Rhodothermales bacterium]
MNGKNRRSGSGSSSVNRQASEWLVLLESGDATDQDRARFEEWQAADPAHREAYAALGETWSRLTAMRERVRAAGDVAPGQDALDGGLRAPARGRRRRHALAWAAAATVLVAAVLGGIVFLPGDSAIPYRTDLGERRTVTLADGSTVELNTDTELLVEYTDERRRISMARGEAFFEVMEEERRPFVVTAGHGAIRAVGTGFAVRLKSPELVSVTVTEGIVEVTHSTGNPSGTALPRETAEPPVLRRGQRAEYDRAATRIEEVPPAELERTQAWRRGLLVFENASLAEVIAEVNRYTETQLVIADAEIGELRLGGTFKTGRLEALLDVLEKGFGIRVTREQPDTIELHAPSADPPS